MALAAASAAAMVVAKCGPSYRIFRGPYDGNKRSTPFASYAQVVEFTIGVNNNSQGPLGFLLVGRRTAHTLWRTLEPLGSGP